MSGLTMKMHKIILALICLLLVPFNLGSARYLPNSQQDQSIETVRIIIVVDHSLSMEQNDPNGLRYYSPVHLADILGTKYLETRAQQLAGSTKQPLRLEYAVVRFASEAEVGLGWTTIDPSDSSAWETHLQRIDGVLNLDQRGIVDLYQRIGNGTNFVRAFETVRDLLQQKVVEDEVARNLVIVLTDGNPALGKDVLEDQVLAEHMALADVIVNGAYYPDNSLKEFCLKSDGAIRERCLDQNGDPEKGTLSGPNSKVYVTGINVPGDDYWRISEGYWQEMTQFDPNQYPLSAQKVNYQSQIGARLARIIHANLGDEVREVRAGSVILPPYLDRVIFTFYKSDRMDTLQLTGPDGTIVDESHPGVSIKGQTDAIETFEFRDPPQGIYALTTSAISDSYLLTQQTIFARSKLLQPEGITQQFKDGQIALVMTDSSGEVLLPDSDPRYRLQAAAAITDSDGETWSFPLIQTDDGLLTAGFTPFSSGMHQIAVEAAVLDINNQQWQVLSPAEDRFNFMVSPVGIMVEEPANQQGENACPAAQYNPFVLPIFLQDQLSGEKVQSDLKLIWTIEKDPTLEASIAEDADSSGYRMIGLSEVAGEHLVSISAQTVDPISGTAFTFDPVNVLVTIEPGYRLALAFDTVKPELPKSALFFEKLFAKITQASYVDQYIPGRAFFLWDRTIVLQASIFDQDRQLEISDPEYLPEVMFQSISSTKNYEDEGWQYAGNGVFEAHFSDLPLDDYQIVFDQETGFCNTSVSKVQDIQTIRLIPGISERVISSFGLLAALWGLAWLVKQALCRIINPINGYLAILDIEHHRLATYQINRTSCWKIRNDDPARRGYVLKLRLNGLFSAKGKFKLSVTRIENGRRKTGIVTMNTKGGGQVYSMPGGYRIMFKKSKSEFPVTTFDE
jgi:hypothetical protein